MGWTSDMAGSTSSDFHLARARLEDLGLRIIDVATRGSLTHSHDPGHPPVLTVRLPAGPTLLISVDHHSPGTRFELARFVGPGQRERYSFETTAGGTHVRIANLSGEGVIELLLRYRDESGPSAAPAQGESALDSDSQGL